MTGSDPLIVEALGVRVAADLSVAQFSSETIATISAGWSRARVAEDPGRPAEVAVSPAILAAQPSPERLAAMLSTAITLAAIDVRAGQLVLLHAAGVADPATGATVALVGPSGRGKTTASRALAQHWGYVSDETVGVDPETLTVWPHPKPLSVKGSGAGPAPASQQVPIPATSQQPPKLQLGPDESGLLTAPEHCRLARVVLLDREPEHGGEPEVTPVGVPRAVGELTAELSHLRHWDDPLATVAGLLTATGGALRVRYADAGDLPELLTGFVTRPAQQTQWWPVPVGPDGTTGPVESTAGVRPTGSWQRLSASHAIADDDTLAVLLTDTDRSRVVVLDGIGPTIWHETAHPRTSAELVAAVVDRHGPPPAGSADAVVAEALASLRGQGVLRVTEQ